MDAGVEKLKGMKVKWGEPQDEDKRMLTWTASRTAVTWRPGEGQ